MGLCLLVTSSTKDLPQLISSLAESLRFSAEAQSLFEIPFSRLHLAWIELTCLVCYETWLVLQA